MLARAMYLYCILQQQICTGTPAYAQIYIRWHTLIYNLIVLCALLLAKRQTSSNSVHCTTHLCMYMIMSHICTREYKYNTDIQVTVFLSLLSLQLLSLRFYAHIFGWKAISQSFNNHLANIQLNFSSSFFQFIFVHSFQMFIIPPMHEQLVFVVYDLLW